MWKSGRDALPETITVGTVILDFYSPELGENELQLFTLSSM